MKADATKRQEMFPYLNKKLWAIFKIDSKIKWFEKKIEELEAEKAKQVEEMDELLDLAVVTSFKLTNGFVIEPDNRHKLEIKDFKAFMLWLKKNYSPNNIMEFLEQNIKVTSLKRFCDRHLNQMRLKGEMNPTIDGIEIIDVNFRKLRTRMKKEKKK